MKTAKRRSETSFTATVAKREFGRVLDTAIEKGKVEITRHGEAEAVVLSMEEYRALAGPRERALEALRKEWDARFEEMQTPKARKAMRDAFYATPEELGRAAVEMARKRG